MILILLFCDLLFPSISNYCYFTSYACWNKWRSGKSLASEAVLHGSSPTLGDFLTNFFQFFGVWRVRGFNPRPKKGILRHPAALMRPPFSERVQKVDQNELYEDLRTPAEVGQIIQFILHIVHIRALKIEKSNFRYYSLHRYSETKFFDKLPLVSAGPHQHDSMKFFALFLKRGVS